jgi:hypothetical protein
MPVQPTCEKINSCNFLMIWLGKLSEIAGTRLILPPMEALNMLILARFIDHNPWHYIARA